MQQRRERVRAMSAEDFDRLRRNYRQFKSLTPAERERLRQLYERIEAHPDRARLVTVMENYHRWVSRLSPADREELLSTPPEERLGKVRELRRRVRPSRGRLRRFGRFAERARMGAFVRVVQALVDEKLTEQQREALAKAADAERMQLLLNYVREQELLAGTTPLGPEKISDERLRAIVKLLPGPRDEPLARQRERLGWRLRMWAVAMTPRSTPVPAIAEDELQRFFSEEVQQSQVARQHFDRMGGGDLVRDRWKRDLTLLYLEAYPEQRPQAPNP